MTLDERSFAEQAEEELYRVVKVFTNVAHHFGNLYSTSKWEGDGESNGESSVDSLNQPIDAATAESLQRQTAAIAKYLDPVRINFSLPQRLHRSEETPLPVSVELSDYIDRREPIAPLVAQKLWRLSQNAMLAAGGIEAEHGRATSIRKTKLADKADAETLTELSSELGRFLCALPTVAPPPYRRLPTKNSPP